MGEDIGANFRFWDGLWDQLGERFITTPQKAIFMQVTFIHTADNHLGYEQYGLKERFNDFARAFLGIIDDAIARHANFVVIAGDLFNKRAIDALTLIQAEEALQRLKAAGIPAIAIEGNHDRSYYRDGISWLQFLSWQGLLQLLDPVWQNGRLGITPWSGETMKGAYVDPVVAPNGARLRVYGLPWYGASTARVMENFAAALAERRAEEDTEGVAYRVLLLHTGVEGIVPQMHGLPTRAQFEPLRGLVDYIALGHVHKSYVIDNWLFNPGSTETWGAEESAWERGYFVTRVNTDVAEGEPKQVAEHIINPRRPFVRMNFQMDGLPDPTAVYEHFERFCAMEARKHGMSSDYEPPGGAPVVDITLTGVLSFAGEALEASRLEEIAKSRFRALTARVRNSTRDTDYDPLEGEDDADGQDRSSRGELELHIFEELLGRDARYQEHMRRWAQTLAEVKTLALDGEEPAAIAQRLREARAALLG